MKTVLLLFSTLLFCHCSKYDKKHTFIIKNINIIDTQNGKLLSNQYIRIHGQKILEISDAELQPSDSAVLIDGTGKYVIPGLWDMHAHYYWNHKESDPLLLANGVIGVREMFGNMQEVRRIRSKQNNHNVFIPEIVSSGSIIDGVPPYWPGSDTTTTESSAIAVVNMQLNQHVDFLKVYTGLNRLSYFAIAREANKNKIPFVGHVPSSVTIWEAIRSKQYSIEHLDGILEACTKFPSELKKFEDESWPQTKRLKFLLETFSNYKLDSLNNILSKSNTWICPTLTVLKSLSSLDDPEFTADPRKKMLSEEIVGSWHQYSISNPEYFNLLRMEFQLKKSIVGKMSRANVKILVGTDFPNPYCFPGYSLHDEMALLVESGLSPLQALKIATYDAAVFLHKESEYGTIKPGKIANLIILKHNPLKNICNTKSIMAVFARGIYFDSTALNKLLE